MFSKWIAKAIVQKTISFFPRPEKVNYFFQKYVTKGVHLTDEHFGHKIQHAIDHIDSLRKHAKVNQDSIILELGTGWYPIVPIIFYLTDSGKVCSVDIHDWMTKERQFLTIRKLFEWRERKLLQGFLDSVNEEKWLLLRKVLDSPSEYNKEMINEMIGLTSVLEDVRNLEMKENSIDFICSNNTLEHIQKDMLYAIFKEFIRVLKPTGIMSHFIDLSDHFAHFDQHITVYNFLKFSEKSWKLIDNRIQPQNRLRFKDYKSMYKDLGIPITEERITNGDPKELEKIDIHSEFLDYTETELAISHGYIVSSFS